MMEEKIEEEILQENGIPVTEGASEGTDAGEEPETAAETPEPEEGPCGAAGDAEHTENGTENADGSAGEDGSAKDAQCDAPAEDDPEAASEDAAAGETAAEESADGGKQGFFSKFMKGDKEKAALQEKVNSLEDRVKRQMAEFENYRKRTEKEKQNMFSMGERNVIEKMLPIVDNFERGLAAIPAEEKDGPVASGMEMVYRQLVKQLEDLGVAPVEAVGQAFDPNFHNAVMQVESDEYPSGTVAQEFQKGYKYHDTVIRYSMVGVVQ